MGDGFRADVGELAAAAPEIRTGGDELHAIRAGEPCASPPASAFGQLDESEEAARWLGMCVERVSKDLDSAVTRAGDIATGVFKSEADYTGSDDQIAGDYYVPWS